MRRFAESQPGHCFHPVRARPKHFPTVHIEPWHIRMNNTASFPFWTPQTTILRKPQRAEPPVFAIFSYRYDAALVTGLIENLRPSIHGYVSLEDKANGELFLDEPVRRGLLLNAVDDACLPSDKPRPRRSASSDTVWRHRRKVDPRPGFGV